MLRTLFDIFRFDGHFYDFSNFVAKILTEMFNYHMCKIYIGGSNNLEKFCKVIIYLDKILGKILKNFYRLYRLPPPIIVALLVDIVT